MNPLERYLNQATRGLWGRRKKEVREELEGHILERVERYQIGGMDKGEALERTIAELGTPKVVSAGMFKVYVAPLLTGSSLVMAMLMTAAVLIVSSSVAQIQLVNQAPIPFCDNPAAQSSKNCLSDRKQTWVNLNSLERELTRQGIRVENSPGIFRLTLRDGQTLDFSPAFSQPPFQEGYLVSFEQDGQRYLTTEALLYPWSPLLDNPMTQLRLSSFKNPVLQTGGASFRLGSETVPVDARVPFTVSVMRRLQVDLKLETQPLFMSMWDGNGSIPYVLPVDAAPGSLYAVVSGAPCQCILPIERAVSIAVDLVEVGRDGLLRFNQVAAKSLEFTDNLKALLNGNTINPHKALLLRLSGQIDRNGTLYQIELPKTRMVYSDSSR